MLIYLPVSLFLSRQRQPRFPSPPSATICRAHKKSWQLEREIEPIDRGRARGTANARASSCSVEHNASRWMRRAPRYRFRSVGGAQHYHMDPRPPDPRPSALHLTPSYIVAVFSLLSFRSPVCPSLNSRMLLGFAHWKHKSYARGTTISSKQAIKRTVIFLNLWAYFCNVLFVYDTNILWICKLFFNSLLNFLLIFLLYFLFLFRQILLINIILVYFIFSFFCPSLLIYFRFLFLHFFYRIA